MTAMEYRNQLIETKKRFGQNAATIAELEAAADAYIAALVEFKQRTKNKKLRIPARGYIIRAI
jgi:hypothetical protein